MQAMAKSIFKRTQKDTLAQPVKQFDRQTLKNSFENPPIFFLTHQDDPQKIKYAQV